ncbi:hypothetical protein SKAU_G00377980 [Synaphobranchus kaupii]|uniref:Uncharacterized protein n=1 Tax=Synaphobranchus kaupii TaxID=118154 RepID=A0A9Q1ED39_SYNKA|nr:hypothetical protein SKAU_G00377980 [Synaphobranchus kaupii]
MKEHVAEWRPVQDSATTTQRTHNSPSWVFSTDIRGSVHLSGLERKRLALVVRLSLRPPLAPPGSGDWPLAALTAPSSSSEVR